MFCCFDMKEESRRDSEDAWRQTVQFSDTTEIDFSQVTDWTHWVRDNMAAILFSRRHLQMDFLEWKYMKFD